jgi:phosphatidylglycerophosphate synthase
MAVPALWRGDLGYIHSGNVEVFDGAAFGGHNKVHSKENPIMNTADESGRRNVATRNAGFAKKFAHVLAGMSITPNQISTLSMVFAALAFVAFWVARENAWLLIAAVAGIQLRLLCNLFDGMVAVEYGKKSSVGDLYNEVPDRMSDALIILGAGVFAAKFPYAMDLAWGGVFLATMTAYLRVFGASLVKHHYFVGPMAKQHRMFVVSLACLVSIFYEPALYVALYVIVVGSAVTCVRRLLLIARDLRRS